MLSAWTTVAGAQRDHTALQAGSSRRYTYGELDAASEILRGYLVDKGVQALDRVGIVLGPSFAELVALIAVVKAGALYVPIDPSLPPSDRRHVVQDAGVHVLLLPGPAERAAAEPLPELHEASCLHVSLDPASGSVLPSATNAACPPPIPAKVDLSGALYIQYTSGSTGAPKGVVGTQAASLHRLQWMWAAHPFQGQETVLRRTMLTFVDSVWEIWGTLLAGMTLFLPPESLSANPVAFWSSALQSNIHRLSLTPSLLSLLLRMGLAFPPSLRYCLSSGEPLPVSLALAFFNATSTTSTSSDASSFTTSPGMWPQLLNLYGSTETSGDATCLALTRDAVSTLSSEEAFVPLGVPLPGCEIEVQEDGILVVRGAVVAQGYYRSGGEFRGSFVTGDVVERMAEGSLQFRGRRDGVLKIRGVRVGLEEVEARTRKALGLEADRAAVVVVEEGQAGGKSLALVIKKQAMHAGSALESVASVLSRLGEDLPSVMVPSHVLFTDEAMPMTNSGKVDRMALASRVRERRERKRPRDSSEEEEGEMPRGKTGVKDVEQWLERTFDKAVGEAKERVEEAKGQPFLLRGGDSLTAAQVLWRIKQTFGVEVTLTQLNWTVGRLAAWIAESEIEASVQGENDGDAEGKGKGGGPETAGGELRLEECWRVSLSKCIDATPVVILDGHVAVIGSHAGIVLAVEVGSGKERWRAQVGGRVEASAAVGDGQRVFVGCHDGRLYAFEGATGEVAWSFQTGAEIKCRPLPLSLPSPSEGPSQPVLIFGSYDGFLYILQQADGALLLRHPIGGSLFASPISVPHPSSPSQSLCLCTNRGHLSLHQPHFPATSPLTLSDIWHVDLGCPAFSTPCLVPSSSLLVLGCIDASIRAFHVSTGHVAWRCTTQGPVFSSPTLSPCGALVYIGCHDGRVRALRAVDGMLEWCVAPPQGPVHKGNQNAIFASPRVHSGEQRVLVLVASCSGRLCVLDARDGGVWCHWEGKGELFSSPVCVGDMLLMGSRDDNLYGLSLSMHADGARGKSEK